MTEEETITVIGGSSSETADVDQTQENSGSPNYLKSTLLCGICLEIFHECVSVIPCMHSFCAGCCSGLIDTVRRLGADHANCPHCRARIGYVCKNFTIRNIVDAFLIENPAIRRPAADLDALNASNLITENVVTLSDILPLPPSPGSGGTAFELEDEDEADMALALEFNRMVRRTMADFPRSSDFTEFHGHYLEMHAGFMGLGNLLSDIDQESVADSYAEQQMRDEEDEDVAEILRHLPPIPEEEPRLGLENDVAAILRRLPPIPEDEPRLRSPHRSQQEQGRTPSPVMMEGDVDDSLPWLMPNLEVRILESYEKDHSLHGRTAYVLDVKGNVSTIHIASLDRYLEIPSECLLPVPPKLQEKCIIIAGEDYGKQGKVVVEDGYEDMIEIFDGGVLSWKRYALTFVCKLAPAQA